MEVEGLWGSVRQCKMQHKAPVISACTGPAKRIRHGKMLPTVGSREELQFVCFELDMLLRFGVVVSLMLKGVLFVIDRASLLL